MAYMPGSGKAHRPGRLAAAVAVLYLGLVAVPPASASRGDAVLVGAGDIADCTNGGDSATASLVNDVSGTVFTLGDNAYETGTSKQFRNCYGPTWGRFKSRTRPAIGNHEYETKGAGAYFAYFGKAAGAKGKGWYSYNAGAWHVVVLNANCDEVGCGKGSEQEKWLKADLAAHPDGCTLAYWHQARFASDDAHGNSAEVGPFWDDLYQAGADLVLNGHAHVYERFAPQTPAGKGDPAHGIREIVVGTGGESHYGFGHVRPNSQVRNDNTFGVLKLTLHTRSYGWEFIPVAGRSFKDSGTGSCH